MSIKRLIIDGLVDSGKFVNVICVRSSEDVELLIQRYSGLQDQPTLTLDLRELSAREKSSLLKFIEEYRGSLAIVVNEHVPPALVSRCTLVEKKVVIEGGSVVSFYTRRVYSNNLRAKLEQLFGGDNVAS